MNAYRVIDMETWVRKDTFMYFQTFDNPCANVTVPLKARAIYQCAKERKESLFLLCLYSLLRAANEVPQMRQRIVDNTIVEFERIAVMTPVQTPNEIFCQIWCEYAPTFSQFAEEVRPLVESAKQGISNVSENFGSDFFCASINPWFHFTSVTHSELTFAQDVPILTWGKMVDGVIPVAMKCNHGFMDGLHFGLFFSNVESSFANPSQLF